MGLNINNPETERLADDLARLTGESLAQAVTEALRERLARVQRERRAPLAERLLVIGRECAERLPEPIRSVGHGDLLYGEDGQPR